MTLYQSTHICRGLCQIIEQVFLAEVPRELFLRAVSVEVLVCVDEILCQQVVAHHREVGGVFHTDLLIGFH